MTKIESQNIKSLITTYILNEQRLPTYNSLIEYNPIFSNLFKIHKLNKQDVGKLILEFYLDKVSAYYKDTEKFPYLESLKRYNEEYRKIFSLFDTKLSGSFQNLMIRYKNDIIFASGKTKMKLLVQDAYRENKVLFDEFFLLNLKRDKKSTKFHQIGKNVQNIVIDMENELVGRMEGGQYGVFSCSTRDRYMKFMKSIFPLYDSIGVVIRY